MSASWRGGASGVRIASIAAECSSRAACSRVSRSWRGAEASLPSYGRYCRLLPPTTDEIVRCLNYWPVATPRTSNSAAGSSLRPTMPLTRNGATQAKGKPAEPAKAKARRDARKAAVERERGTAPAFGTLA